MLLRKEINRLFYAGKTNNGCFQTLFCSFNLPSLSQVLWGRLLVQPRELPPSSLTMQVNALSASTYHPAEILKAL